MLVAVSLALLSLVAGCYRYRAVATINPDGTVSGSVTIGYSPDLIKVAKELNGPRFDPVADLRKNLTATTAAMSSGTTAIRPYAADDYTGYQTTFSDLSPTDFATLLRTAGDDPGENQDVRFTLARTGPDFAFTAEFPPTKPGQIAIPPEAFRSVEVVLSLTFPGPVTRANGDISGNTVTWRPRLPFEGRLEAVGAGGLAATNGPAGSVPPAGSSLTPAGETISTGTTMAIVGAAAALLAATAAAVTLRIRANRRRGT